MAGRPKAQLSEDAKTLLKQWLQRSGDREAEANQAKKIDVFEAWQLGLTTREIGEVYGVDPKTAARWKDEGEALVREQEERDRKRGPGPLRSVQ